MTEPTVEQLRSNIEILFNTIGADVARCGKCNALIWWVTTKNGKSAPFTPDALSHFADCPHASHYRKGKE